MIPLLGMAGVIISLYLLKRGRAALMALDVFLMVKWLIFLGLLTAGFASYFNILDQVEWARHARPRRSIHNSSPHDCVNDPESASIRGKCLLVAPERTSLCQDMSSDLNPEAPWITRTSRSSARAAAAPP